LDNFSVVFLIIYNCVSELNLKPCFGSYRC